MGPDKLDRGHLTGLTVPATRRHLLFASTQVCSARRQRKTQVVRSKLKCSASSNEEGCLDVEPEVLFCCKRKLKQTLKINSSSAQAVDVAILANVRVLLPIIPVLFVSSSFLGVVGGANSLCRLRGICSMQYDDLLLSLLHLEDSPDVLCCVAELAACNAGTEVEVADTDTVVLDGVRKVIIALGHSTDEDGNALVLV